MIGQMSDVLASASPEESMLSTIAETIAHTVKLPYVQLETANGTIVCPYSTSKKPPNKSIHANCERPIFNGYVPAKKWGIVATIASPKSRDFKRCAAGAFR